MIKFLPLGGAGEIGANSYYINIEGTGIVLDCGMHPLKVGLEALPKFDLIKDLPVDYVLISHAHQDHLSALPFLVQRHPYIKIITTPQTRAIAELTLHNSISILSEQLTSEEKALMNSKHLKVYSHEEIDLLIQSIEYKAYNESFIINGYNHQSKYNVNCNFRDAGHILGSASIYIEHNGKTILYSGDIRLSDQELIPGAKITPMKIDTLIMETTYGNSDTSLIPLWRDESLRLASAMNSVLISGGSILIPIFSLGKMQEIISVIWNLMQKGKIIQTDIYSGGISEKVSRIYDYNRYSVNRIDPNFEINSIPQKSIYEINQPDDFFKQPCIVLAPSGMMVEGTASFNFAKFWLRDKVSAIFTVGYMEPNSPGHIISISKKGDKIKLNGYSEEIEVQCSIQKFRFPSHSNREELLEIVTILSPKKIILIHGETKSVDYMSSAILKKFNDVNLFQAKLGNQIILD